MKNKIIIDTIAGLLLVLFLYTAISKLSDFEAFKSSLYEAPLINQRYIIFIAWLLPVTEILVSGLLFIPTTQRLGLWASIVLLLVFSIYIGYMLIAVEHLPCSCGGVIKELTIPQHLVFNCFFMGLTIWALYLTNKQQSFIAIKSRLEAENPDKKK